MRPFKAPSLKQWRCLEYVPHRQLTSSPAPLRLPQLHTTRRSFQTRSYNTGDGQTLEVHTKRGSLSWRRRFLWTLAFIAIYKGSGWILREQLGITVEVTTNPKEDSETEVEEQKSVGEEEKVDEDLDEVEDPWFIPFQWPVKLEKTYYKGTDPEWQEFVRFSQDDENQSRSKDAIANEVAEKVSHHPVLRQRLGSEISALNHWLDCTFPSSPPQEYARRGLLLDGDELADSTQVMSEADYNDLRHVLWPDAFVIAAKKSLAFYVSLKWIQLKQMLDISLSPKEQLRFLSFQKFSSEMDRRERASQTVEDVNAQRKEIAQNLRSKNVGGVAGDDSKLPEDQQPTHSTPGPEDANGSTKPPSDSSKASDRSTFKTLVPFLRSSRPNQDETISLPRPPRSFFACQHIFRGEFLRRFVQYNDFVRPRGSFMISGQVEVTGSKGRAKILVESCWDSKEMKAFWTRLIMVEGYWPHKQAPR